MSFTVTSVKSCNTDTLSNDHSHDLPLPSPKIHVGLSEDELLIARNGPYWKPVRISLLILFWFLWAGMLAGTTVIVVLNNGYEPSDTTTLETTAATTTRHN